MKNQHEGSRCFIIGNGPGLDLYDVQALVPEITFGSNLIFRRFIPIYYVCCNPLVQEQYSQDIDMIRSFQRPRKMFLDLPYTSNPIFQTDPDGPFWQGYTVTYVALQLAFIMGCNPVYLVGCDHDYGTLNGDPNEKRVYPPWKGQVKHAAGLGYHGRAWNLPDLDRSYQAYKLAAETFAAADRSIYIIPPTKLDLFEEVRWDTLFPGRRQ